MAGRWLEKYLSFEGCCAGHPPSLETGFETCQKSSFSFTRYLGATVRSEIKPSGKRPGIGGWKETLNHKLPIPCIHTTSFAFHTMANLYNMANTPPSWLALRSTDGPCDRFTHHRTSVQQTKWRTKNASMARMYAVVQNILLREEFSFLTEREARF